MKKIVIIFYGLLLALFLSNSSIWGQEPAEEIAVTNVNINPGPVFNPDSTFLGTIYWQSWMTVYNNTTDTLNIENFEWPSNSTKRPDKLIPPATSVTYYYYCPKDSGTFQFRIAGTPSDTLKVVVKCLHCMMCPSLTQPGMIILIILIMVVGVSLWIRRKPVSP